MTKQRPVRKETDFLCQYGPEGFNRPPMQVGKCSQALGVFLIFIFLSVPCHAEVLTASYYDLASLKAEGTYKYSKGVMANGQRFSDVRLTAACNIFPLNSWLRITSIENGKSVIVKNTDRIGKRFATTRIDLSKKAFLNLADGHLEICIVLNIRE